MSGVGEASLALGLISSIIQIISAAKDLYDTANDVNGLPKAFHDVAAKLPIILILLKEAEEYTKSPGVDLKTCDAFRRILGPSEKRAQELHEIFTKVLPKEGASRVERYVLAVRKVGKGGRVENLIEEILKEMNLLSAYFSFPESTRRAIASAWEEVLMMEPSLLESFDTESTRVNLKKLKYQSAQSYPQQGSKQDLEDFLRIWLVPEVLLATDSVSDQKSHLGKRFRNPESLYTTCEWIFGTTEYLKFLDTGASVLRINGSPGCGKSILSSAVIDRLQGDQTSLVLYFYGHQDPEPTTSMTLVRVLLEQTLQWESPQIVTELNKFYSKHHIIKNDSKTEEELWHLLRQVLALESKKVYIVVDALDEFAHPHICVRSLIKVMTRLAATTKPSLLISSRLEGRDAFDNKAIQAALTKSQVQSSQLEITQERTCEDLKQFVSHRVISHPSFEFKSDEIRGKIISGVCERANGMFLWANLVLDDLKDDRISSPSAIDITLAKLPKGLSNIYKQNLEIPSGSIKGPEVFSWIFCANPALSWHELKSALAIGGSGYDETELVDDTCEVYIHHSCGPLVESYGPSECLRFIHPTVKDFLVNELGNDGSGFELGIAKAHSMVARKLLTFLDYPDLPRFSSTNDEYPEATLKAYSLQAGRGLYSFATFNWFKHLKECDKSEDPDLENQVLLFLVSPSLIRWLKSAIILSHSTGRGNSVSITVDVIDGIQGWVQGRHWADSHSAEKVQTWIKDFLGLMLDWGTVLDTQPDWIHYLHHELLPENNSFREILEEDNDQGVIQFHAGRVPTKSSEASTWPGRSIAVDLERDLAFTYEEPFLSCYHMQTGLLTAETLIPVPSLVNGPLLARKGALCKEGKYLAVMFEAMGPSNDPVGSQIRSGQRLTFDDSRCKLAWSLEKATGTDVSQVVAHMIFGIDHAVFVVCLLELQHEGPARTHLFGLPRWTTSPILGIGTQTMRWELDDVDVLTFSPDSSRLATPFGIYELDSGKKTRPWPFALDLLFHGGKVTGDFETFGTVSSIFEESNLQLHDVKTKTIRHTFDLPGAVHILAISYHGAFLLLLRIQILEKKSAGKGATLLSQQATIGIWDCHEQSEQRWTQILMLDPLSFRKRTCWNFSHYIFPSCFGPEAKKESDVNRVLLYAPPGWKLTKNISPVSFLEPREGHLLLLEAKKSTSPRKKFGKYLMLKLQLPTTYLRSQNTITHPGPAILSWSLDFETAFVYDNNSIKSMTRAQLKETVLVTHNDQRLTSKNTTSRTASRLGQRSALLISPNRSEAFHVLISTKLSDGRGQSLPLDAPQTAPRNDQRDLYEISVSCLREGESLPLLSSVTHMSLPTIYYPSLESLYMCASGESSLTLGCLELDLCHTYDDMKIEIKDPEDTIFQRALRSFASRARPLGHKTRSEIVKWNRNSPNTGYAIFEDGDMSFEGNDSSEQITRPFLANGASTSQEHIHIFQFSRGFDKNPGERNHQEARQFEVFLCIFDSLQDKITWLMHTTTCGEIAQSKAAFPEIAWALHPHLPLLVWILPGHRLRVSNIESHEPPITVAESLTLEAESTTAIRFSPNGRFVAIQARETFKNDFMNFRTDQTLWSVVVCDLLEGKTIEATLTSDSTLSFDVEDEFLRTYRLKRDGAIESSVYTLPDLELSERQYLTFLPVHCSCSTCGKPFEPHCNISIMEFQEDRSVVLCHSTINVGKARVNIQTCEPLILRITSPPVQLELNSAEVHDSSFRISSCVEFLKVLGGQGRMLEDAFDDSRRRCDKKAESGCSCCICKATKIPSGNPLEPRGVFQLRAMISDFKLTTENRLSVRPEDVEETYQEMEKMWATKLSIGKESEFNARRTLLQYKNLLGDEYFPWDTWGEFREAMDDIKDEFDFDTYMKGLFEPGKCGIGCNNPLPVTTFFFKDCAEPSKLEFRWSSAMAVGWVEEDLKWFYDRLFGGDFEGARRWYPFPAYHALNARVEVLKADKTEKGARFRKVWEGKPDASPQPTLEQRLQLALPETENSKETDSDMKAGGGIGGLLFPVKLKEVFEAVSDIVPGFGNFFEQRMHMMLNQSMIGEIID